MKHCDLKKKLNLYIMTEQNYSKQDMLKNKFFSKDLIASLNKVVQQQINVPNLSRDAKQDIVNTLVKNMKTVYKQIDLNTVTGNNIDKVFDQFKKYSLNYTISDLKSTTMATSPMVSAADHKFQRDFTSNPNPGNRVMDRPESTKATPSSLNQKVQNIEQRRKDNSFQGISSDMTYDSNLDQAFRPIIDDIAEQQNSFNNYNTDKKDISSRMESVQQMRQTEVTRNNRPPTPDFLKSKKTNPDKNNNDMRQIVKTNTSNTMSNNSGQPDFQNADSSQFNQGFMGLSNDMKGEDLFSLDNIDKPLVEGEIEEDKSSFEDRLKRLQSDRTNIGPMPPQQNIDFTKPAEDLMSQAKMMEQQRNNMIPRKEQFNNTSQETIVSRRETQSNNSNQDMMVSRRESNSQPDMMVSRRESNNMVSRRESNNSNQDMVMRDANPNQEMMVSRRDGPNNKLAELKNSMKANNIEVKEDIQRLEMMRSLISKLEEENQRLKDRLSTDNNESARINELKEQIANEFSDLTKKNEDLDNKYQMMNLKESELLKKETDVKQLITNYDYLFKTNQVQMEVTNQYNSSSYIWPINNGKTTSYNVTGLKLMSYSLPTPRFNIEENKNNCLSLKVNDANTINVEVETGKYSIEELISILDSKLKESDNSLSILLNSQQHIIIESNDSTKELTIISTVLSRTNLGFINVVTSNRLVSDNSWDLRIEDKVYLYLNNISEDVPFGILYFNGMSICQFKFQSPFMLDKLDIMFKDSKGNKYNFYNLSHTLNILLDTIQ